MGKYDFITINFAAILGILFLLVFLHQNGKIDKTIKKSFYGLIVLEIVEMSVYSAELVTASLSYLTIWRIFFSVLGYSIRPILVLIILIISRRFDLNKKKKLILMIPALINIMIVGTAFFCDLSFGYTQNNVFYRGPLGYSAHVTLALYILLLLIYTTKENLKRNTFEHAIIYLMSAVIVASVVIEALFSVRSIGRTALVMCTVFYYMFFQTEEYNQKLEKESRQIEGLNSRIQLDSMTNLLNKEAFQKACLKSIQNNGTDSIAFLFIDLDHFKQVNDQLGHLSGDKAIVETAHEIKKVFRNEDLVSRFGGDEFCVCIRNIEYEILQFKLENICKIIKKEYWNESHSKSVSITCSIGAAYCASGRDAEYGQLIKMADRAVYKAKDTGRDKYIIVQLEKA